MAPSNAILSDGVMEAKVSYGGWVLIRWVGEQTMRFTKKLYKDFKEVESQIRLNGLRGWMVASEPEHTKMHKIFERLGAINYGRDEDHLFFRKELNHV